MTEKNEKLLKELAAKFKSFMKAEIEFLDRVLKQVNEPKEFLLKNQEFLSFIQKIEQSKKYLGDNVTLFNQIKLEEDPFSYCRTLMNATHKIVEDGLACNDLLLENSHSIKGNMDMDGLRSFSVHLPRYKQLLEQIVKTASNIKKDDSDFVKLFDSSQLDSDLDSFDSKIELFNKTVRSIDENLEKTKLLLIEQPKTIFQSNEQNNIDSINNIDDIDESEVEVISFDESTEEIIQRGKANIAKALPNHPRLAELIMIECEKKGEDSTYLEKIKFSNKKNLNHFGFKAIQQLGKKISAIANSRDLIGDLKKIGIKIDDRRLNMEDLKKRIKQDTYFSLMNRDLRMVLHNVGVREISVRYDKMLRFQSVISFHRSPTQFLIRKLNSAYKDKKDSSIVNKILFQLGLDKEKIQDVLRQLDFEQPSSKLLSNQGQKR